MNTPPITRPCTLTLRAPDAVDEYNDETLAETTVDTVCELQQSTAIEESTGGIILTDRWNLYLLPDETVDGLSAVTVDGADYEIFGQPWPARHPITGQLTHIEAVARRVA